MSKARGFFRRLIETAGEWRKTAVSAATIVILEVGARIGLPGVDREAVRLYMDSGAQNRLLDVYGLIGGGGLSRAGILALGILPYLAALAWVRLFRIVSPATERLAATAAGRDRLRLGTRIVTTGFALIQSFGFATFLQQRVPGAVANPGIGFTATTMLVLTSGSLLMMWLGERFADTEDEADAPASELSAHPVGEPALLEPGLPASHSLHPRPSTDAETLRTRR